MKVRARSVGGLALLITMLSLAMGCLGYRLGPVGTLDYQSVSVPMFRNRTTTPQLEAQVTNAIIKRLQRDATLRIEPRETADVVVDGEITRYHRVVLRTERQDTGVPREYRVHVTARISIRDQRTGEWVLKPTEFVGDTDTFVGTDLQSADLQALPLAADDLARQVVGYLAERWDATEPVSPAAP